MANLESLLTKPGGFNLQTATNVQRAICRAIQGLPIGDLWDDINVQHTFGGVKPKAGVKPREVMLTSGIRSGKSVIASTVSVYNALTCDTSNLGPGEMARVSVVSVSKDTADATFSHILGHIQDSPTLKKLMVKKPTTDTVVIKNLRGDPVEIKVVASTRAGFSLVSRWSAGITFEETARWLGSDEGAINLEDSRSAVLGRMLEGSQILYISSPWRGRGPLYKWYLEHFRKPSDQWLVMKARGPDMNPVHWTPERCKEVEDADPVVYRTDVLGEWADPESNMFSSAEIAEVTRKHPAVVPPKDNQFYIGAMDPATRGNAWTFIVMTCTGYGGPDGMCPIYQVVLAKEWMGQKGKPLNVTEVLREISHYYNEYGLDHVVSDQWAADSIKDIAERFGVVVIDEAITGKNKFKLIDAVKSAISNKTLELPPVSRLTDDLMGVVKRVSMDRDNMKAIFPKTADGRHCDFVPPLALALMHPPDAPMVEEKEEDTMKEQFLRSLDENSLASRLGWLDFSRDMGYF